MKKQVEGKTSKQAPANRTIYYQNIYFRRCGDINGYLPITSESIARVNTWISCGNQVQVIARYEGYAMHRNSASVTPSMWEKVIYDLDRKHPITNKLLERWANRNNAQGLRVTF